jgi:hypothetical protein
MVEKVMQDPKRFEIAMPASRRVELERLADELGTSSADLARLAIIRMLNDPGSLTGRKKPVQEAAA